MFALVVFGSDLVDDLLDDQGLTGLHWVMNADQDKSNAVVVGYGRG